MHVASEGAIRSRLSLRIAFLSVYSSLLLQLRTQSLRNAGGYAVKIVT